MKNMLNPLAVVFLLALLILPAQGIDAEEGKVEHPNIILIMADDMGYRKDSTSKGKHYGFLLNRVVLCEW